MATTQINGGQLEIDHGRGVIYFHHPDGHTLLRICNIPKPIPNIPVCQYCTEFATVVSITDTPYCAYHAQGHQISHIVQPFQLDYRMEESNA